MPSIAQALTAIKAHNRTNKVLSMSMQAMHEETCPRCGKRVHTTIHLLALCCGECGHVFHELLDIAEMSLVLKLQGWRE